MAQQKKSETKGTIWKTRILEVLYALVVIFFCEFVLFIATVFGWGLVVRTIDGVKDIGLPLTTMQGTSIVTQLKTLFVLNVVIGVLAGVVYFGARFGRVISRSRRVDLFVGFFLHVGIVSLPGYAWHWILNEVLKASELDTQPIRPIDWILMVVIMTFSSWITIVLSGFSIRLIMRQHRKDEVMENSTARTHMLQSVRTKKR